MRSRRGSRVVALCSTWGVERAAVIVSPDVMRLSEEISGLMRAVLQRRARPAHRIQVVHPEFSRRRAKRGRLLIGIRDSKIHPRINCS
jgi:hypothetical protein